MEFRARWKLDAPLPGLLFALRLAPAQTSLLPAWRKLLPKSCFQQGYPVLYGLWGLNPTPPGFLHEQVGKYIIPSNALSGLYHLEIGYSQIYPPTYSNWVPLGDHLTVRLQSRPLPTNGP